MFFFAGFFDDEFVALPAGTVCGFDSIVGVVVVVEIDEGVRAFDGDFADLAVFAEEVS